MNCYVSFFWDQKCEQVNRSRNRRKRKEVSEEEDQGPGPLERLINLKNRFADFHEDFLNEDTLEDYRDKVYNLSTEIQAFCVGGADLMLAYFQLNREDEYEVIQPLYTSVICEILGAKKKMPMDDRRLVIAAALTHDIGMHTLKDVLKYQETPLTPDQLADLKLHPIRSIKLLRDSGVKEKIWMQSVQQHHERLDGTGYPYGLLLEDISIGARMIAIADIYIAMTKPHAHRQGSFAKDALSELFANRGDKVDNELTQLFIREMGLFPPGAVVRLMNGDIAMVTHRGKNATTPVVQSIVGPRGAPLLKPIPRNTNHEAFAIRDMEQDEEYRQIAFSSAMDLWTQKKLHFSSS